MSDPRFINLKLGYSYKLYMSRLSLLQVGFLQFWRSCEDGYFIYHCCIVVCSYSYVGISFLACSRKWYYVVVEVYGDVFWLCIMRSHCMIMLWYVILYFIPHDCDWVDDFYYFCCLYIVLSSAILSITYYYFATRLGTTYYYLFKILMSCVGAK